MLKNYFKTFFRTLIRQKLFSSINILSLTIGLACSMLILIFILNEVGYDSYHEKKENLYRVTTNIELLSKGEKYNVATSSILWAPVMKNELSGIKDFVRLYQNPFSQEPLSLVFKDDMYEEENYVFVDESLFDVFSWSLKNGDPETALTEPSTVVISETIKNKYYSNSESIIGEILTLQTEVDNEYGSTSLVNEEYKITGVLNEIPGKTHVRPDLIFSFRMLNKMMEGNIVEGSHPTDWYWRGRIAHTYLLLEEGTNPAELEAQFHPFIDKYVDEATSTRGYRYDLLLTRIDDIHLVADTWYNFQEPADKDTIYLLSISALLILLIAIINFINLSTAKATSRSKEVGIRKVVGATKKKLVFQYLGESVLISFISFLLAAFIVYLISPTFFYYLGKTYTLTGDQLLNYVLIVMGLTLVVGLLSGSFSAFILSQFNPSKVLKGELRAGRKGAFFRKGLVVTQFAITVIFTIVTIVVFNQIEYMQNKELGFDKERLLVVNPSTNETVLGNLESIRNTLLSSTEITNAAISTSVPGAPIGGDVWGNVNRPNDEALLLVELSVDYNYLDIFDLELLAGRNFDRSFGQDSAPTGDFERPFTISVIINEEAVRQLGYSSPEEALGNEIVRDPASKDFIGRIIGVVKDFNYDTLEKNIDPLVMFINANYASNIRCLTVKYSGSNTSEVIGLVEATYKEVNPNTEFNYFFVDENFASLYEEQQRTGEIYAYVSILTVLIAVMGLFGLSIFSTQRRTKEIAIRKIVGSSIPKLVMLLTKEFVVLLIIANLIAWPAAYYFVSGWLEDFAYRTDISILIFFIAALVSIIITLITVSYQVIRAANRNPVDSIKYE